MNLKGKDILIEISKGNSVVFKELFQEYYSVLCHFSERYVLDLAIAEDIVQEIFTKLWERKEGVVINTSIKSYLFQTTKNYSLNYIKHNAAQKKYEAHKKYVSKDSFFYEAMEAEEINLFVYKAMDLLPPKCRQIFQMNLFEDKTHDEIAVEMGITKKTVYNQLGKALKIIREYLVDNEIVISFLSLLCMMG